MTRPKKQKKMIFFFYTVYHSDIKIGSKGKSIIYQHTIPPFLRPSSFWIEMSSFQEI